MRDRNPPRWLDQATWFYSQVETEPYRVTVRRHVGDEMTDDNLDPLVLRLEPRFWATRVFNADEQFRGVIRREGVVPRLRFVWTREQTVVWKLTARSFVLKHHRLQIVNDATWTIDTPFFWWQHLEGIVDGETSMAGMIGPHVRIWGWALEPGRDTFELLTAIAFMHWKWWRF